MLYQSNPENFHQMYKGFPRPKNHSKNGAAKKNRNFGDFRSQYILTKFGSEIVEKINRTKDSTNVLADVDLIKNVLDNFLVNDNEHLSKLTPLGL